MTISNWPANERPREKLLEKGADALDLARELLDKFQGLRHLADTDHKEFCTTKGLGMVKYVQIQAAIELGRR